jgi:hypothetical protein
MKKSVLDEVMELQRQRQRRTSNDSDYSGVESNTTDWTETSSLMTANQEPLRRSISSTLGLREKHSHSIAATSPRTDDLDQSRAGGDYSDDPSGFRGQSGTPGSFAISPFARLHQPRNVSYSAVR